eukprot:1611857-Rhodomonas_salina.3
MLLYAILTHNHDSTRRYSREGRRKRRVLPARPANQDHQGPKIARAKQDTTSPTQIYLRELQSQAYDCPNQPGGNYKARIEACAGGSLCLISRPVRLGAGRCQGQTTFSDPEHIDSTTMCGAREWGVRTACPASPTPTAQVRLLVESDYCYVRKQVPSSDIARKRGLGQIRRRVVAS